MNKHRLGVSHRRGGLFYRLYFITVCHLHRGMLIASCDYLHIWKSTSICHVPPISHESVPPSQTNNCCLFTRWQAAPKPGDTCTLHPAVWHMWTSHKHTHIHTETSHLAMSHPPHNPHFSITTFLKVTIHNVFRSPPPWHLCLPLRFERIHMERHSCQLSKNLSILISQKGIMGLITYIVI